MSLADRVMQLAAEAARLAAELLPQRDLSRDLLDRMQHHDLRVTHGGHALFTTSGMAFSGSDPFRIEDLILRAADRTLEVDYLGELRWLALNAKIANGSDLVLTLDYETAITTPANAFIRCRSADGKHSDGPKVALGGGTVRVDRYIRHPAMTATDYSSQLFLTFDHFSRTSIRKIALAFA